jgi:thiosulfate/3-mercaptopyruvate sulfurtransferase
MTQRPLIGSTDLFENLHGTDVRIFDCSFDLGDPAAGLARYIENHIPGAAYLHLEHDLSSPPTGANGRHPLPDPEILEATLRKSGLRQEDQVVAYDDGDGAYAARFWWLLRWLGHESVTVLDGGKRGWIDAGFPLQSGFAPTWLGGDFIVGPRDAGALVGADNLIETLGSNHVLIVDARSPERFRGDPNPLDPVAGHIPGARNRFFKDNLTETGHFRTPTELRKAFEALLESRPSAQVVLQCGSGVTACHNALAMEIAGLDRARLYPGSWSEWIADPSRPVEREQ